MRGVLLVFPADEFDEIGVERDSLVDLDGPRLSVGPGVLDGGFDFEVAEVRPAE